MRFLLEYKRLGNIKNLGEAELAKLIETNLNQYSPTDANELMLSWCKQHFKNWKYIEAMYPLISDYIVDNGIKDINNKNNNLWKFLDTFNAAKLTPSQANILYNCLTDKENDYYVNASEPLIHVPQAYRSDKFLQTYIFLSNDNNIRKFGLGDKKEILQDLKNINNDSDLQKYINSKQTKFESSVADELLTDSRTRNYFKNSKSSEELNISDVKELLKDISDRITINPVKKGLLDNDEFIKTIIEKLIKTTINDRDVIKVTLDILDKRLKETNLA